MTDKLFFWGLYMTDVRDPEEVSYGDLFPYFDQIRDDHQPNLTQSSNDDLSLSSRKKRNKKHTLNRNHISHQNVPEKRK